MKELYDDNTEKVAEFTEELYRSSQTFRRSWADQVKRNVAFANGDQTPYTNAAPLMVNNQPSNYSMSSDSRQSTYQANEIEPIIRTLSSYMTRAKPAVEVYPESQDEASKNVARIADRVLESKYDLNKEYQKSNEAAFWALTSGTVFRKDYWDYSLGDYTNALDPQGNVIIDPNTGMPVMSEQQTGNNNVAILTGMSVGCDDSIVDFDEQPYVNESYIMDVDWARESFDRDEPGYTGKSQNITEDGFSSDSLSVLEDMKFSIPHVQQGAGNRPKSSGKCLVQEWFMRPNGSYPKGRMLIKAGNICVFDSGKEGSPYFMASDDRIWHPYSIFRFENYVGRFLGKSLVEQLITLQIRLNEINGAILENANTMAKPNIMAAIGQLKKGILNGKGSNVYTYQMIPGASPPFVMQGTPLPSQFFQERQNIIDQMVRIAGTNFVMQGQPPTGVTASSAISQLLENANNQHSDMMNNWEHFHENGFTKKLRIIHKFNQTVDRGLERYLKTMAKDALDQQITDFIGAKDLTDGLSIKVQSGSMIPKSDAVKTDKLTEFIKEGAFGPLDQNPKVRDEIMEQLGLKTFDNEESIELKKAKWENDLMLHGRYIEVSEFDVAQVHLPCHIGKIQDPKFLEAAKPEQYDMLMAHIKEHQAIEAEKAQAQQEEMMKQQLMGQIMPQAQEPQAQEEQVLQ